MQVLSALELQLLIAYKPKPSSFLRNPAARPGLYGVPQTRSLVQVHRNYLAQQEELA